MFAAARQVIEAVATGTGREVASVTLACAEPSGDGVLAGYDVELASQQGPDERIRLFIDTATNPAAASGQPTTEVGMAFHRSALALASAPLEVPAGTQPGETIVMRLKKEDGTGNDVGAHFKDANSWKCT